MASRKVAFRGKALTIVCTDLRRSVQFYEGVLGAVRLPGDGYGCPWFRLGSLVLTLMPNATEPSPAPDETHAMTMLWLEAEDLKAAHALFLRSGAEIRRPPDDDLFMVVADPDGLLLEV